MSERHDNHERHNKHERHDRDDIIHHGCPTVATQIATVNQPVTSRPFVVTGPVSVECEGRPVITEDEADCRRHSCCFTVSQKLRIEIPMEFGAKVRIGESSVECGRVTAGVDEAPNVYARDGE